MLCDLVFEYLLFSWWSLDNLPDGLQFCSVSDLQFNEKISRRQQLSVMISGLRQRLEYLCSMFDYTCSFIVK